jgi:hypothetical protein
MHGYVDRLIGACRLDAAIFEEVELDRRALPQAALTVILVGVAAGVGATAPSGSLGPLPGTIAAALVVWTSWALVVFGLGVAMAEPSTRTDPGELARTLGFSAAPGLALLPLACLRAPWQWWVALAIVLAWMTAAMVVAVRQALDFSTTWRAAVVCLAGTALVVSLVVLFGLAFGPALW